MAELPFTEYVENGEYAMYPFTPDYTEPEMEAHVFVGWEYNGHIYEPAEFAEQNPFGPITAETNILARWKAVTVSCWTDVLIFDYESHEISIYYMANGGQITSTDVHLYKDNSSTINVTIDDSESTEITGICRELRVTIPENTSTSSKFLKVYAEYKGIRSELVTIEQTDQSIIIIPPSDYFIFTYSFTNQDGKDLDSLTVLTLENKDDEGVYHEVTTSFTNKGVGYLAGSELKNDKQMLCVKHGGDNMSNQGAEGAILCFTNMTEDSHVNGLSKITANIYANWYSIKANGKMSISCKAFKHISSEGHENPDYDYDINEVEHVDGTYRYKTFEAVEGHCDEVWTKEQTNIHINAYGHDNIRYIYYDVGYSCAGQFYSDVCSVVFTMQNGGKQYVPRVADNGLDLSSPFYGIYDENQTETYRYDLSPEGQNFAVNGLHTLYRGNQYTYDYNMFDDDNDTIVLKWYEGPTSNVKTITLSKTDFENAPEHTITYTEAETYYLQNFKMKLNTNGGIDISFKITANNDTFIRNLDIIFNKHFSSGCRLSFNKTIGIYQNKISS